MTSYPRSLPLPLALCLSCLLAAGCTQLANSFVETSKLHVKIVREYGEKEVNVNLHNSTSLNVTFINSPLNVKGQEERANRAEQTAAFVKQHYPLIDQITEIWVVFVRQKTHLIVVHYYENLDFFGFDKNARPLTRTPESPPASAPDNSLRPVVVYSTTSNQTEVTIDGMQLAGDLNQGMSVSPHFIVPGDATGVRRSSSFPRSVSLDFASYSEKSLFPGEPKITFLADGKVAFQTSAQFSTAKNPDGLFFESLFLQIPYPAFRRMTTGKKLTLRIGDREYEFTGEQVEALREMTQYVGE